MKNGFTPLIKKPCSLERGIKRLNNKAKKPCFLGRGLTGLSLIEILIYVAVLIIVSTALLSSLLKLVEFYNITCFERDILTNANFGLKTMLSEIKQASSVYLPTSQLSQISLQTDLNPPVGETKTYVDFYLDNGRLCLKREGEDAQALTSERVEVTDLDFEYLSSSTDPSSVKISIKVRYRSSKPIYQRELTLNSTASLRSY